MQGKPWAALYHKAYDMNMMTNVSVVLLAAIISAFFVCWILIKQTNTSFGTTFISTLFDRYRWVSVHSLSMNIWFQTPGAYDQFC